MTDDRFPADALFLKFGFLQAGAFGHQAIYALAAIIAAILITHCIRRRR
jgi:hypothetical protein